MPAVQQETQALARRQLIGCAILGQCWGEEEEEEEGGWGRGWGGRGWGRGGRREEGRRW
jgi:hypothetical protein